MSQMTHLVSVNLRKTILEENLSQFCNELKDHVDTALSDVLEPDEHKDCNVVKYQIVTKDNYWQMTLHVELVLVHAEVFEDIENIVRNVVLEHTDSFSP